MDGLDQESVKSWLKSAGKDRQWLANQCGVALGTVNNWLSAGRPITGASARIIRDLMGGRQELKPKLELQTYQALQRMAKAQGTTIDLLIAEIIEKHVAENGGAR